MSVARSISLDAPVVTASFPKIISSATRPPNRLVICPMSFLLLMLYLSSSGRNIVTPSALPRGTMVTLYTGSCSSRLSPTIAWPASWYAVSLFSSSLITKDLLSAPIMILSLAFSKSSMVTCFLLPLAAIRADSLTRFAKSAPENPGVPLAMIEGFTFLSRGTFLIWTLRICSLPLTSGSGTTTWRSNLPGLRSAESRTSGLLVAAITITPTLSSKPSISTRS